MSILSRDGTPVGSRPGSRSSPRGDMGSEEMGFSPRTEGGQSANNLDTAVLPHAVDTLRRCHDHEIPVTALGPYQPVRPTRHAPWKSDAERIMLAAETSLAARSRRLAPHAAPPEALARDAGRTGRVKGEGPGVGALMMATPIRVGRKGFGGTMRNTSMYVAVAKTVSDKAPSVAQQAAAAAAAAAATDPSSSQETSEVSVPQPQPQPHQPQPQPPRSPGGERPTSGRSPFAKFDMMGQTFTNPVAQELWAEVHKHSAASGGGSCDPSLRDPTFLLDEGIPRLLPGGKSSMALASRVPSPAAPSRFASSASQVP